MHKAKNKYLNLSNSVFKTIRFPACNLVLNIAGSQAQRSLMPFHPLYTEIYQKNFSLTLIQALNQKNNPKQTLPDGGGRVLFTIEIRMLKAKQQLPGPKAPAKYTHPTLTNAAIWL